MRCPRTPAEEALVIAALAPVITTLGRALGRNNELVLHDLRQPERSVVAIVNGHITGRQVGSPAIGGPQQDRAIAAVQETLVPSPENAYTVLDNYITQTRDGRQLRSSTVVLRNATGRPYAAVCLNCDQTLWQMLHSELAALLRTEPEPQSAASGGPPNIDDLMTEIVAEALRMVGKPGAAMDKEDKLRAVALMEERGLFLIKSSVEQAAHALGVSRFTIYNYLEEIRGRARVQQRNAGPA